MELECRGNKAIENLLTGALIKLHLRSESLIEEELRIQYESKPYLTQLPTDKRIVSVAEKNNVSPVSEGNYILSVLLEAETHEIDLCDKKTKKNTSVHPITLFYIKSQIEKFAEDPFSVLCFNWSPTMIFVDKQREKLSLKLTLTALNSSIKYQGNIPVSFKVFVLDMFH